MKKKFPKVFYISEVGKGRNRELSLFRYSSFRAARDQYRYDPVSIIHKFVEVPIKFKKKSK